MSQSTHSIETREGDRVDDLAADEAMNERTPDTWSIALAVSTWIRHHPEKAREELRKYEQAETAELRMLQKKRASPGASTPGKPGDTAGAATVGAAGALSSFSSSSSSEASSNSSS